MYRLIATLTLCLAIAPWAHAQYGGQSSSPGSQPNPFDYGQIQKLSMPWVPSVPLVTPADYARTRRDQYMLNYLLMYSGFYGPYWGSQENTYAGSTNGYGGTNNAYATKPSYSSQNPYNQNTPKQNTYTTPANAPREQPLATAAYPNHEPLLGGLADLKLSDVHVQRGDVINARAWMKGKELTTLIESVNGNEKLFRNADRLTERLQAAGLLHAGDRVVGFADGKVYVLLAGVR